MSNQLLKLQELDREIENIVHLMNKFAGIKTLYSCAGHAGEAHSDCFVSGYILFEAETLEAIEKLLNVLPHSEYGFDKPAYRGSQISVRKIEGQNIRFNLELGGKDFNTQREWLKKVEDSLKEYFRIKC